MKKRAPKNPRWKIVIRPSQINAALLRTEVPGGWLYRTEYLDGVALAFVPKPLGIMGTTLKKMSPLKMRDLERALGESKGRVR